MSQPGKGLPVWLAGLSGAGLSGLRYASACPAFAASHGRICLPRRLLAPADLFLAGFALGQLFLGTAVGPLWT